MKTKIFVFYYLDSQKDNLIQGDLFIPHKNLKTNLFVENQLVYDVVKENIIENCEYLGFLSHKHWMVDFCKSLEPENPFRNFSSRSLDNETLKKFLDTTDADVINLININAHDTFKLGEAYHPGMLKLLNLYLKKMGIPADVSTFSQSPIYRNFYIMKKEYLVDFVDNYLDKMFELTFSDPEIYKFAIIEQVNYHKEAPAPFVENTGFNRYTLVLFLLERFINLYVNIKNLKIVGY